MSVYVEKHIWKIPMPPIKKMVAIALAFHAHDDGSESYPSQKTLMKITGLSVQSVRRSLDELQKDGVIVLYRKASQHRSNCYWFVLPEGMTTFSDTPQVPLAKSRGTSQDSEVPSGTPEVPTGHPNNEEQLYKENGIVNLDEVRRKNREIFKVMK